MGRLSDKVFAERAIRNAARDEFDMNLEQVKADLDARSVGGRIADKVSEEARFAYEEAVAVAQDNKGVLAGTLAALLVWFLRNPIIQALDSLLDDKGENQEEE